MEEIPAGMMDADSNFSGVAMKEISEETGLEPPSENELQYISEIIPSAGGCDEKIKLFFWKTTISENKKDELLSKIHGEADENESIMLKFIPLNEFPEYILQTGDVKGISALFAAQLKGFL
jgi:8-oxo-dGTP pyrophosphatase MutT (NUDIX family)